MPQWKILAYCAVGLLLLLLDVIQAFHTTTSPASPLPLFTTTARTTETTTTRTTTECRVQTVQPGDCFRDTVVGQEVSIVSLNLLAPSYHFLGQSDNNNDDAALEASDRAQRIPQSIESAKQSNADILLLQEVEGEAHEDLLRECLQRRLPNDNQPGYDAYCWSALHPDRPADSVGLAVAWRSSRYQLVSCDSFRRGMVVQLQEKVGAATLTVANLHLFAKPSAIEGRLKVMASAIRRIEGLEQKSTISTTRSSSSPLDGLIVVGGDFNCDDPSVTTRYLTTGSTPYGRLRERNYTAKVSKVTAASMRHRFPFGNVYHAAPLRAAAPITVSLKGRGPGRTDHLFFVSGDHHQLYRTTTRQQAAQKLNGTTSKRQLRRNRARERSQQHAAPRPKMCVHSVLATLNDDDQRTRTIMEGLPNESLGFPSDHLPIGALLAPDLGYAPPEATVTPNTCRSRAPPYYDQRNQHSLSPNARRRRQAYAQSTAVRRRHNSVLRAVAEWLTNDLSATKMMRDQPLYKWEWTAGVEALRKKMRAPDLCCVVGDTLVVVEVTTVGTTARVDEVRKNKLRKYNDLVELLRQADSVMHANLDVAKVHVLVFGDDGTIPAATRDDLQSLQGLSSDVDRDDNRDPSIEHSITEILTESS